MNGEGRRTERGEKSQKAKLKGNNLGDTSCTTTALVGYIKFEKRDGLCEQPCKAIG